jgi:hypothetical protein
MLDPAVPRCGSDAAVTATAGPEGGTRYTCHFSHSGEGNVSWQAEPERSSGAKRASSARRERSRSPGSSAGVNDQAITAVIAEVVRRGGRARVERSGNKKEIIASSGRGGEVVLVVRARTAGDWQSSIAYGEPRAHEEYPTRFWVLVDLYPEATNFYIAPEWRMANDIHEHHQAYLDAHCGSRAVNDDSNHHRIETARVGQWPAGGINSDCRTTCGADRRSLPRFGDAAYCNAATNQDQTS